MLMTPIARSSGVGAREQVVQASIDGVHDPPGRAMLPALTWTRCML
jgi:hypothetical protein